MKRRMVVMLFAAVALGAAPVSAQDEESSLTLGYDPGWFILGGLTGGASFGEPGRGGFLGGELSVVRLGNSWWNGLYADIAYDFGHHEPTFTVGPEFGWMVLGVDGGVGVKPGEDGGVQLGPQVRGLLTFAVFSLYARFAYWPDATQKNVQQYGVLLKFPLAMPWGQGPSAAWDMGDKPKEER